ncbi:AI-2E family transporter [Candidatus Saccharibacteria bacterium]|jgi:predicted PurR-regulated permease PerM|nr:AI-2E family transporter [Candidatus Saccharibacteria bacterium]
MKVKIQIDTKTFVRFWLVVIGFGLVGLALYSARTALVMVLVSFFLALALNSPVNYLARMMPGKSRLGGTAVAFVAVVTVVMGFLFLVIPPMIQQTAHFAETIPDLIDKNRSHIDSASSLVERYSLQPQVDKAIDNVKTKATEWAGNIGINIISGVGSIFSAVVSLILVLVMSFLMLLEGPVWMKRIWSVYTDNTVMKHHQKLVARMYDVMKGYVNGQIAVAGIAGVAAGITVFIMSVFIEDLSGNLTMPVAAIAFVLSLVPMFGATIAGVLITILLALNSVTAAIIFLIYFVVYQQIENNFVSPAIQAKTVQLSALIVLVSVTIGTYMFGLIGGLVSIPIAGWIKVLVEDYLDNRKKVKKPKDSNGVKLISKIRQSAKTAK